MATFSVKENYERQLKRKFKIALFKLEFHRENRTHRAASAETHRHFNIRFFGQMPPDASNFPGGIPALDK